MNGTGCAGYSVSRKQTLPRRLTRYTLMFPTFEGEMIYHNYV